MMEVQGSNVVYLDTKHPVWERFFTVAPLVLIGTQEPDGGHDLAPKHMAMPVSWQNYFGFVCAPRCLFLECRLERIVEGLGGNSLIIGRVVAAAVDAGALRTSDDDDQALLHNSPLLVYLYPGRTATVADTVAFPFPRGFKR